jgi:hypothetical protein
VRGSSAGFMGDHLVALEFAGRVAGWGSPSGRRWREREADESMDS